MKFPSPEIAEVVLNDFAKDKWVWARASDVKSTCVALSSESNHSMCVQPPLLYLIFGEFSQVSNPTLHGMVRRVVPDFPSHATRVCWGVNFEGTDAQLCRVRSTRTASFFLYFGTVFVVYKRGAVYNVCDCKSLYGFPLTGLSFKQRIDHAHRCVQLMSSDDVVMNNIRVGNLSKTLDACDEGGVAVVNDAYNYFIGV